MTDNELCRICLKDCQKSFTLNRIVSLSATKASGATQTNFGDIYNLITNLEATVGDSLTQFFCNNCFDDVLKAYQTIKLAQETHKLLWRVLNNAKGSSTNGDQSLEPYTFEKRQKPAESEDLDTSSTSIIPNPVSCNEKVKCHLCKDLVPKKYVDFHYRKYHNNQGTQKISFSNGLSSISPSPSTAAPNESFQKSECIIKTEEIENFEITTEEKIFSLLQDLKEDVELVKNKVFDIRMDLPSDISLGDNSIFPMGTIAELESVEDKIANDPQFKHELYQRFRSMGGKTETDFFRNIARNIYSDELLQEVTWEGTLVKKKFSSFGNLIYLQINAINSSDDNFNSTWNMAKEFYKGYLKNAPARLKKKIDYVAGKNRNNFC